MHPTRCLFVLVLVAGTMNVSPQHTVQPAHPNSTMQNLLQSLSAQRLRLNIQDGDLKRLLSAVKDGRVRALRSLSG